MVDYAAMSKELPKLRAALTRAKNSKDPKKVLAVAERALARFDVIGWPDQWATWQIAADDARIKIRMGRPF